MLETNIRIVQPGRDLTVSTRQAVVRGAFVSADLVQKAATTLQFRHGLATVPASDGAHALIVGSNEPVPTIDLAGDDWELQIADAGLATRCLGLDDAEGSRYLPDLLERALQTRLARSNDLWSMNSRRIWYESHPFKEDCGLRVHRRFETAALHLDGVGVGIAIDVGTAFFSVYDLAWFFDPRLSKMERDRRAALFDELTRRQSNQKGTLLYDLGYRRMTCYFEEAPGVTCGTTGSFRIDGESFESALDYYQEKRPHLPVHADTPAVRVSFQNAARPVWVAANRLRPRVMNSDVPHSLNSVDKISPGDRRRLIERFWERVGANPLGQAAPQGVSDDFWRPPADKVFLLPVPTLTFGKNRPLQPPNQRTADVYQRHFKSRRHTLARYGSYGIPLATNRMIPCAYPKHLDETVAAQFASNIASTILEYTGIRVETSLVAYDTVNDVAAELGGPDQSGVALVILNEEPAAYHEVAHRLSEWRIKRVTERQLGRHYDLLKKGWHDRATGVTDLVRGENRWKEFISFCALDLLQLLDVVPFRVAQAGPYEAQLAIDVGHDRRHLALSLLVARSQDRAPSFRLETHVATKADHHREEINAVILRDKIVDLVETTLRRPCAGLASLLVIRDGKLGREEIKGIDDAIVRLQTTGKVAADARVDLIELLKDTSVCVRLWEIERDHRIHNPLEGTSLRLDEQRLVVVTTGGATLRQGTADPLLIVGNGRCHSILDAAAAVFAGAQLNWSSPAVAQKLPISLKRTDEVLTARAAQEIRRFR